MKLSGTQADRGLRTTSRIGNGNFPRASTLIERDIYVDDCLSGENSWDMIVQMTDDLQLVLAREGFAVKGFAFTGRHPMVHLMSTFLKRLTLGFEISDYFA